MRRKQLARAFPVWLIFLLGMLVGQAVGQSGAVDGTFNPGSGVNGAVYAMAVQADGKLVIGGEFTAFNGIPRSNLARLNADGSLDTTFTPGSIAGRVEALVVQSDGKVVIGGSSPAWAASRAGAWPGSTPTARWIPALSPKRMPMASSMRWRSAVMGGCSSPEILLLWQASGGSVSPSSNPVVRWMPASIPMRQPTAPSLRWPFSPTDVFWWVEPLPRSTEVPAVGWRG